MKKTLRLLPILLATCAAAHAQVAPAASAGPAYWNYSLHASDSAEFGSTLGTWQSVTGSANVNYANGSGRLPLVLAYAGGYREDYGGPSYTDGFFQHLYISQGLVWK